MVFPATPRPPGPSTRFATISCSARANLGDTGHKGQSARLRPLPTATEVCGCNGVMQGRRSCKAIKEKGPLLAGRCAQAHQGERLRPAGRARGLSSKSSPCSPLGATYSKPADDKAKPMCGCTDAILTRRCARRSGAEKLLDRSSPPMRFLGMAYAQWMCHLPAGGELLHALHLAPRGRRMTRSRRFINERSSCQYPEGRNVLVSMPRMWGGETSSADELRRIADVVDKYSHPDRQGHRRAAH